MTKEYTDDAPAIGSDTCCEACLKKQTQTSAEYLRAHHAQHLGVPNLDCIKREIRSMNIPKLNKDFAAERIWKHNESQGRELINFIAVSLEHIDTATMLGK